MKKKILLIAAFKKEIEGLFKKYSFTKVEKKETFPYGSLYQSKLYDLWICGLAVHSIKQKKIYLLSSEARNEIKKKIHLSYPVIINIGVAGAIDKSLKKKNG